MMLNASFTHVTMCFRMLTLSEELKDGENQTIIRIVFAFSALDVLTVSCVLFQKRVNSAPTLRGFI